MSNNKTIFNKKGRLLLCGMTLVALGLTATSPVSVKADNEEVSSNNITKNASKNSPAQDKTPNDAEKSVTTNWNGIKVSFDTDSKTLVIPNCEINPQDGKNFEAINSIIDGKKIDKIKHITLEGKVKITGSAAYMFANLDKLTDITGLDNLDTSEVTDMSFMFEGCTKLNSINLSNFDTSKVTDMNAMFYDCSDLTDLNVSKFNTLKVTSMMSMFNNCTNLKSITGLNNFNVNDVNFLAYMFNDDKKLISLDLSGFKMKQNKAYFEENMLQGLTSLTSLTLNKETTINNSGFNTPIIWQNVGKGNLEKPEATETITSSDLAAKYDGNHSKLPENETYIFFKQANSASEVPATPTIPSVPSIPTPIIPNHDSEKNPTGSSENKIQPVDRTIIHNAYLYNKSGKRINGKYVTGTNVKTYGTEYINGKPFYSLGADQFVKANNISGVTRKLTHNAFEYNSKGKRANRKVLRKNKTVRTYGGAIKIYGKKFYMISKNRFVKKANF